MVSTGECQQYRPAVEGAQTGLVISSGGVSAVQAESLTHESMICAKLTNSQKCLPEKGTHGLLGVEAAPQPPQPPDSELLRSASVPTLRSELPR